MIPDAQTHAPIVNIDFTKPRRQSYQRVDARYPGLYSDPRTGKFYERPFVHGRQTWRLLKSSTPKAAHLELMDNRSKQALARVGRATDPYRAEAGMTMAQLFDFYEASGCPRKNRSSERAAKSLKAELTSIASLRGFWQSKRFSDITLQDCGEYHTWRVSRITRNTGDSMVDRELVTLSNVFRWAMRNARKTGVKYNPIAVERERFKDPRTVRHCREFQPADASELHFLAARLFERHDSEVLGWQYLFEAFCGSRSHEILRLRMDAKLPYQPGFIQGEFSGLKPINYPELPRQAIEPGTPLLFLYDSQTSKGTFPFIPVHRALGELLTAFRSWHRRRYPKNPWYFPGRGKGTCIAPQSLGHALRRICALHKLPHRTSHGARSYFVNVLRSRGVPDGEIALMIGQKTQGKLIIEVYGRIPTHHLAWLPESQPTAWNIFAD